MDPAVVDEIARAVADRGEITKAEIVEAWGFDDEAYRSLVAALRSRPGIESGPPRIGGFVAKMRRSSDDGDVSAAPTLTTEWERETVDRLEALLSQPELLRLVGALESTIRTARRVRTGKDRPSRKNELATALVLQHSVDLFADPTIRDRVARAARAHCPSRWHAGKRAAVEFVIASGFPIELAGVPSDETTPDLEYLEGRFKLEPLQHFQREVQRKIMARIDQIGLRCIVTLPTGAGKTRVAVESLAVWMQDRYDREAERATQGTVLWLAHTEELCEQACACFKQVWEGSEHVAPMTLVRLWGSHMSDLAENALTLREVLRKPSVIVSTPQRLTNLLQRTSRGAELVIDDLLDALGVIVIDEAHRAAAPMYREILSSLIRPERRLSVFGLTATPFRREYFDRDPEKGTRDLKEIFHDLVEPDETLGVDPRAKLEDMRVLARPDFLTIETGTMISIPDLPESPELTEMEMERIDRVMATRTDNTLRRLRILEELLPIAQDPRNSILYFGPSVRDAECMAYLLREQGIAAAVISGATRDVTRRQVVNDFKKDVVKVLCNCEVLTTGFDAPRVTHVVMARPTVSRVLYEQIVGRGLRGPKFGGTESCVIIDVVDDFRGERPPLGYESFRRIWYDRLV
jgi:DNA repair protein RadD